MRLQKGRTRLLHELTGQVLSHELFLTQNIALWKRLFSMYKWCISSRVGSMFDDSRTCTIESLIGSRSLKRKCTTNTSCSSARRSDFLAEMGRRCMVSKRCALGHRSKKGVLLSSRARDLSCLPRTSASIENYRKRCPLSGLQVVYRSDWMR